MKNLFLYTLFVMAFTVAMPAVLKAETVETYVTCIEDTEADQWLEVGIAINEEWPRLRILVLENDNAADSTRLVLEKSVSRSYKGSKTIYQDRKKNIKLVVRHWKGNYVGKLTWVKDGPGGFKNKKFVCHDDGQLNFDRE